MKSLITIFCSMLFASIPIYVAYELMQYLLGLVPNGDWAGLVKILICFVMFWLGAGILFFAVVVAGAVGAYLSVLIFGVD